MYVWTYVGTYEGTANEPRSRHEAAVWRQGPPVPSNSRATDCHRLPPTFTNLSYHSQTCNLTLMTLACLLSLSHLFTTYLSLALSLSLSISVFPEESNSLTCPTFSSSFSNGSSGSFLCQENLCVVDWERRPIKEPSFFQHPPILPSFYQLTQDLDLVSYSLQSRSWYPFSLL